MGYLKPRRRLASWRHRIDGVRPPQTCRFQTPWVCLNAQGKSAEPVPHSYLTRHGVAVFEQVFFLSIFLLVAAILFSLRHRFHPVYLADKHMCVFMELLSNGNELVWFGGCGSHT